jgi:S-adenosylmethionine/arginine decarboxylase-like enzyme
MTAPDLVIEPRDDTLGTWHGTRLLMELGRCDPAVVRGRLPLATWMKEVAAQTGMVPAGPPLLKHFGRGELAGEIVIQVTEDGNGSVHGNVDVHGFDDDVSAALCVNSRAAFDAAAALAFTRKFFDAGTARARVVHSYIPPAGTRRLAVEPRDDTLGVWRGMRLLMDLGGCDPAVVRSSQALGAWIENVAARIGMVTFGQPLKRQTGDTRTLVQMIETSNIDAWGFGDKLAAGLCVFSCKPFDPAAALNYTTEFFDAGAARARVVHSYIPGVSTKGIR